MSAWPPHSWPLGFHPGDTLAHSRSILARDVRDFGGHCDGVTDDTAAVVAAIAVGAGAVVCPGPCKVTGPITFPAGVAYAPLYGGGLVADVAAYTSSPFNITLQGPILADAQQQIFFGALGAFAPAQYGVAARFSVKWWGAQGDGATDDTTAIQAAMTASPKYSDLGFPDGNYLHTAPLRMNSVPFRLSGLALSEGNQEGSATLVHHDPTGTSWTGPSLSICPENWPHPYTYTTNGAFVYINFSNNVGDNGPRAILLSESDIGHINGLTAFCFQGMYDLQSVTGVQLASSSGKYNPASTLNQAFALSVNSSLAVAFRLTFDQNASGDSGVADLTSPNSSIAGTGPQHVAATFDGTTMRIFVQGVQVASRTTTNAGHSIAGHQIVQKPWETFALGYAEIGAFYYSTAGAAYGFRMASVELANVARYTTGFTPPAAEVAADSHTIALFNFDAANIVFSNTYVLAKSSVNGRPVGSPVYVFLGHGQASNGLLTYPQIYHLGIDTRSSTNAANTAIFTAVSLYTRYEGIFINSEDVGIVILGGWSHKIEKCIIGCNTRGRSNWSANIMYYENAQPAITVRDCTFTGGNFTFVSGNGGDFSDFFVVGAMPLFAGGVFSGAASNAARLRMTLGIWDDEFAPVPSVIAGLIIVGIGNVQLRANSYVGQISATQPLIRMSGCGTVDISDDYSFLNPGIPGIVTFDGQPANGEPVVIRTQNKFAAPAVPWVDPTHPGPVVVGQQNTHGAVTNNFTADANMTLASDDMWWGVRIVTDVGVGHPLLTAQRDVIDAFSTHIAGRREVVINQTAQPIRRIGQSGNGIIIAAGKSAMIYDDGTNKIRLTPDT